MPRFSDSTGKDEFHCNVAVPRETYQQLRILSAKTTLGMKLLYRRAIIEYAERETQQQAAAAAK